MKRFQSVREGREDREREKDNSKDVPELNLSN